MAVQDIVQMVLGIVLTYLEVAVLLVLVYMLFQLLTGGKDLGEVVDWVRNRTGSGNRSSNARRNRNNRNNNDDGDANDEGEAPPAERVPQVTILQHPTPEDPNEFVIRVE